jgi:type II secretory pathway pseudopilin PulG
LTLLEVAIALAVLVFAVLAFVQALVTTSESAVTTRELVKAEQAARARIEAMQAAEFADVFALYDTSPANDPGIPGSAPGKGFEVDGLEVLPADADGLVGEVIFAENDPGTLREDSQSVELGMPRDLNGDTVVDGADHSGDYRILPVRVRVAWNGANGPASMELKTILADY